MMRIMATREGLGGRLWGAMGMGKRNIVVVVVGLCWVVVSV